MGVAKSVYRFLHIGIGTYIDRRFDKRFGTDTGGYTAPSELDVVAKDQEAAFEFLPTPERAFKHMIGQLTIEPADFTFVDFGSGKGRTLILAALHQFKQSIGVEFSERLSRIAQSNIQQLSRDAFDGDNIQAIHVDALEFEIPDGPCVLYFYSPFRSPIIDQVLENIRQSHSNKSRPIHIVYLDYVDSEFPIPHQLLNQSPFKHRISGPIPFDFANLEPLHFSVYSTEM
ncbi:MAG: class I SAM-dependent methyltransferase [Planctomycetota bacterium]